MQLLVTIVVFLLIFSLLIFVHELGHFTAAKRAGVKVEEFGFGLPPRLWGVKKGETIYSINWIPFGGFVRMLGEDGRVSRSKRNFGNQPLRTQAWIVCAGVVMNLALAFVLLTVGFWMGIEPLIVDADDFMTAVQKGQVELQAGTADEGEEVYFSRMSYVPSEASLFHDVLEAGDSIIQVNGMEVFDEADIVEAFAYAEVAELLVHREGELLTLSNLPLIVRSPVVSFVDADSPAEAADLQVGDQILNIGGEDLARAEQVMELNAKYASNEGLVDYEILREDTIYNVEIQLNEEGRVGIGIANIVPYYGELSLYAQPLQHHIVEIHDEQYTWQAPAVALKEMWRLGRLTGVMFVDVLGQFLSGGAVPEGVAGPVGIAQMTGVTLQHGFAAMLRFVALLSLSLGVVNILPIPALDGGRLIFILYRGITGHNANPRVEHYIHMAGFLLLLSFIAYVTFNDVLNLL